MRRTSTQRLWGATSRQFTEAFLDVGKQLTRLGIQEFSRIAEETLAAQDAKWPHSTLIKRKGKKPLRFGGDHNHPWYYGQLHDSVAIAITDKNRLVSVRYMTPSPDAKKTQHMSLEDGGIIRHIKGTEWGFRAASEDVLKYSFVGGIKFHYVVGVPYAKKVDESSRHREFIRNLADELMVNVIDFMDEGSLWKRRLIRSRV